MHHDRPARRRQRRRGGPSSWRTWRVLLAGALAFLSLGCANTPAQPEPPTVDTTVSTEGEADDEGPVAQVELLGIAADAITPTPPPLPCDAPRWRAERAERDWRQAIALARRRAGDYTASVQVRLRAARPETPCWGLRLRVTPGVGVKLRNVQLAVQDGNDDAFAEVLRNTSLRSGEDFVEARYEAVKAELVRIADARGYFDARFERARVDVYTAETVADVDLLFAPGPRYHFGPIELHTAATRIPPEMLLAMAPFATGEPYDDARLDDYRRRLAEAGYFASVDVRARPNAAADQQVPIRVVAEPLPNASGSLGAGFATDIGPRGQATFENRFAGDRGQQLSAVATASPVIAEATLGYRIPSANPAERWWTFDGGFSRERTDDADTDTATIGVRQIDLLASGWRRTIALDLLRERFETGDDEGRSTLLAPSLRFERSGGSARHGDLDLGWRSALVVSGAHEALLSDASFLQVLLEGRYAFAAGRRARIVLRGDLGTSWIAGFAELPPSYRLYAGGDDSVRGYGFKSLGAVDDDNDVRGGRHRVTASIEFERQFARTWSWAAFVDAGNAFDDPPATLRVGVGVGVRWLSPVGSVRIDIAHPLVDSDQRVRLHIGIGRVQ